MAVVAADCYRRLLLIVAMLATFGRVVSAQEITPTALPAGWVPPNGLFSEPGFLRKLVDASDGAVNDDAERDDGPYAALAKMVTGAGWISAGPGYRHQVFDGGAFIDLSAALSWRLYKGWPGVTEMLECFEADWHRHAFEPREESHLVW
jgi:hypothetical protein